MVVTGIARFLRWFVFYLILLFILDVQQDLPRSVERPSMIYLVDLLGFTPLRFISGSLADSAVFDFFWR